MYWPNEREGGKGREGSRTFFFFLRVVMAGSMRDACMYDMRIICVHLCVGLSCGCSGGRRGYLVFCYGVLVISVAAVSFGCWMSPGGRGVGGRCRFADGQQRVLCFVFRLCLPVRKQFVFFCSHGSIFVSLID